MGFLKRAKKKSTASTPDTAVSPTSTASFGLASPPTETKSRWSPLRKRRQSSSSSTSSSKQRSASSTREGSIKKKELGAKNLLSTLNVVASDNIEVLTLESQRALMEQREEIRKELFDTPMGETDDSSYSQPKNSSSSHRHGSPGALAYSRTPPMSNSSSMQRTKLSAEQASMPLNALSGSWDGSLRKIVEEDVEYQGEAIADSDNMIDTPLRTDGVPSSPDVSPTPPELNESVEVTPLEEFHLTSSGSPSSRSHRIATSENMPAGSSNVSPPTRNSGEEEVPRTRVMVVENDGRTSLVLAEDNRVVTPTDGQILITPPEAVESAKSMENEEKTEPEQKVKANVSFEDQVSEKDQRRATSFSQSKTSITMASSGGKVSKSRSVDSILKEARTDTVRASSPFSATSAGTTTVRSGLTTTDNSSAPSTFATTASNKNLARSLMDAAFVCGGVGGDSSGKRDDGSLATGTTTSMTRNDPVSSQTRRPMCLDESATSRFLRRITTNGFVLLYLVPQANQPAHEATSANENSPAVEDWAGRTVTLQIVPGHAADAGPDMQTLPKLEWVTAIGGQSVNARTTSVPLLEISSIAVEDGETGKNGAEDTAADMCFFTITTEKGDVHIFEAATVDERDRIVHGLRTIIARWCFHAIAGDPTATSELYQHDFTFGSRRKNRLRAKRNQDDIPSLPNPSKTMNVVAHAILDQ